jgi:hypothetical protein
MRTRRMFINVSCAMRSVKVIGAARVDDGGDVLAADAQGLGRFRHAHAERTTR